MDDDYLEAVMLLVEQVPAGRVTTYGVVAQALGSGGPRQVGSALALCGDAVPWWRVVRADGSLPPSHAVRARPEYLGEGTPLRSSGKVDLGQALWFPGSVPEVPGPVSEPGG